MERIIEAQVRSEFEKLFGEIREEWGFSLIVKKVKSGILAMKYYQRNSWVSPDLEKKVLFSNGIVYENHKKIAEYNLTPSNKEDKQ